MTVASGSVALMGTVAADPTVHFAFSNVRDGNMSLAVGQAHGSARGRLAAAVGATPHDVVFMQQVHGAGVAVVTAADRGRGAQAHAAGIPAVDALVSFDTDVALAVLVADCVPVVLCDPGRAVAVAHAGRGGVVAGVIAATVAAMAADAPARMSAVIGPAIGGCCYEVGGELADRVVARVPAARAVTTWSTPALDLPAAVDAQLRGLGIRAIERLGGCTRCDGERWFSHRRAPGQGRQAGVVVRSTVAAFAPRRHDEGRHA